MLAKWDPGGRLNIKIPSYQHRDPHVKDKTVSPTVLSLTWESPYLGKTVFILRRGPGFGIVAELTLHWHFHSSHRSSATDYLSGCGNYIMFVIHTSIKQTFDAFASTFMKLLIIWIEELFASANANLYENCQRSEPDDGNTWVPCQRRHGCKHPAHKTTYVIYMEVGCVFEILQKFKCRNHIKCSKYFFLRLCC